MMIYIENGIHDQILEKNVGEISHPTASTTVKYLHTGFFGGCLSCT